jgi:hypothetical protein
MKDITLPKILEPFYCPNIIRLGKDHDGGYLVNKEDVLKSSRLLSFGVGDDTSFEEDFVKLNDCKIDAYDGTIEKQSEFFSNENRTLHFNNVGHKLGFKKVSNMLSETDKDVFIKCDIEGAEYEILDELIIYSSKLSGIVIEFHDIHEYPLFNLLSNFIAKTSLKLVHTHMNNWSYLETPNGYLPGCIELTFTSSDNIMLSSVSLPHRLDMTNAECREEFRISF